MKSVGLAFRVCIREIAGRWVLVPAAIVVGTLAMLAIHSIEHVRGDADGIMTGTWIGTLVVSVIVGMSLLGHELMNGRLSFYFARPFTPGAIFGGKLAAGVVLALVIQGAIITLVALSLPALAWQGSALAARGVGAVVGERILATAACTLVGMAASIVIGSKARWFVVDIACLVTMGVFAAWLVVRVSEVVDHGGSVAHAAIVQVGAFAIAVLGIGIATARALARGRTDRERAHAALSMTLWPIMMPASCLMLVATLLWL
jgi:hypothetical protein